MIRLSPSSLERYALCPGAYWAEQGMPYQASDYAAEGTLLHSVLGGSATPEQKASLTRAQKADIEFCVREAKALHVEIFGGTTVDGCISETKLQAKLDADVLLSGQTDYFAFKSSSVGYPFQAEEDACNALLIDWKFGRDAVDIAASNLQIRAYAVLLDAGVDGLQGKTRVHCAIIQPRVALQDRVTRVVYEPEDIKQARQELLDIASAIRFCGEQRNPGKEQCKYCKALGTDRCPESADTAKALAPLALGDVMPTPERLAQALDLAVVAESVIERYRDYAKEFIAAGGVIPGWSLKEGNTVRKLKCAGKAWECAQEVLSPEEFIDACRVGVVDLQNAMADKRRWTQREARANFDHIMAPALTSEQNAPSLVRDKREKQLVLVGGQPS